MPYNTKIPGQQSDFELRAIELAASLVPENKIKSALDTCLYRLTAYEFGVSFDDNLFNAWRKVVPDLSYQPRHLFIGHRTATPLRAAQILSRLLDK